MGDNLGLMFLSMSAYISRTIRWLFFIFGTIAVLVSGSLAFHGWYKSKSCILTTGEVIDLRTRGYRPMSGRRPARPIVSFTAQDGKTYVTYGLVLTYPPAYTLGEKIPVCYDPRSPENAKIQSFTELWLLPLIFGLLGGVFFMLVFIFYLQSIFRRKKINALKQKGRKIEADVISIEQKKSIRIKGERPYVVTCSWKEGSFGKVFTYKSPFLWLHEVKFFTIGEKAVLFIDKENPKKFCFEKLE